MLNVGRYIVYFMQSWEFNHLDLNPGVKITLGSLFVFLKNYFVKSKP